MTDELPTPPFEALNIQPLHPVPNTDDTPIRVRLDVIISNQKILFDNQRAVAEHFADWSDQLNLLQALMDYYGLQSGVV